MATIFKNFGKTFVLLCSTVLQLIALGLRVISLIFETIGLLFRTGSVALMDVSTFLLNKIGVMKTQAIEETNA